MSVAEPIVIPPAKPCRHVAASSTFYAAMRILPRAQREGMFEIYAFCRQVDDIADGEGSCDNRLEGLERWRNDIEDLYAGRPSQHLHNLARIVDTFSLDRVNFLAVIDGMEMDARATIVGPDLPTLDLYCDRVASAVGRLSVKVFGMPDHDGQALAHHLGRALQLTNILRDIDEDADIGRVYLPRETLAEAGIMSPQPSLIRTASLDAACAPLVQQARGHFETARDVMSRCPRSMVTAPCLMAQAYSAVLDKLITRGFAAPRLRVRVSRLRLGAMLLRQTLF